MMDYVCTVHQIVHILQYNVCLFILEEVYKLDDETIHCLCTLYMSVFSRGQTSVHCVHCVRTIHCLCLCT